MPLLEVQNLSVFFSNSNIAALDSLSFHLEKGETLGIVGESGSGKSVSALSIMRLLPNTATVKGTILFSHPDKNFQTVDLLSLSMDKFIKYRGRNISMIFQEPMTALNPVMKCGKQVEEVLKLHSGLLRKDRKSKVVSLFEEVKLPDPEGTYIKYPHQLSGGQRQRVMIAMAIACQPDILIADEPTTALDATTQIEIISLLKEIQQQHALSIIFISHDLKLVGKISNRIIVMRKGKLIEEGSSSKIFNYPEQQYTRALINCKPPLNGRPYRLTTISETGDIINNNSSTFDAVRNPQYNSSPILEVKYLNVWLASSGSLIAHNKQNPILKQVNLRLWPDETLGIVGESGSGKTTLGKTLMQLIKSYEGEIFLFGTPVKTLIKKDRQKFYRTIQLIFQDPYSSLNPKMTIGEIIREPVIVHNIIPSAKNQVSRVKELLNAVSIEPSWYNRYPHELSGGQRQRVVIARALAMEPKIIICDESVSALDVSIAAQILNLLNDLKEKFNLSYIFISHDLNVVRYMSDRIIVLKDGKIIEENGADALFSNPVEDYTRKLIQAAM
jgi:peptide/nickel transport system ATP-binding protein